MLLAYLLIVPYSKVKEQIVNERHLRATVTMVVLHILCLAVILQTSWAIDSTCQDIDTQACVLIQQQNPSFCHNKTSADMAERACKKFCNLCRLLCFDCVNKTTNEADCTGISTCAIGEQCLLATYKSSTDGHYEYSMRCASYEHCDGREYFEIIGRRDIEPRSISMNCCTEDLCNNPFYNSAEATTRRSELPKTTAPVCIRDIVFLVQDSVTQSHDDIMAVRYFLKAVSSRMRLGPHGNMIGAAVFHGAIHGQSDVTLQDNLTDVYQTIDNMQHVFGNMTIGKRRPNIDNSLVFIVDAKTHDQGQVSIPDGSSFNDVIIIAVGDGKLAPVVANMATSPSHIITVLDYIALFTIENQTVTLICS